MDNKYPLARQGLLTKRMSLRLQNRARLLLKKPHFKIYSFETAALTRIVQLDRRLIVAEADRVMAVWGREKQRFADRIREARQKTLSRLTDSPT